MKEYFEKYGSRIFFMGLFVFLIHGAKLHSGIVGIDTEDIIHIQNDFYGGWLNTGRQGLWFLKWLMGSLNFQPYMAGLLTFVFLTAAVCALFMLWDGIGEYRKERRILPWILGGLFLISHPVLTEQFYFSLQSVEICIGFLLTVLALYLVNKYRKHKKIWLLLCSTLILVLTFSVYQIFVAIFIFGTVSVLFTDAMKRYSREEGLSGIDFLKNLVPYISTFLVAFLVNSIITNLFFHTSDYLGGQVLWGKFAIKDNIKAILGHIFRTLTGTGNIHYHWSFGLLVLFTISLVVVYLVKNHKNHKKSACFILAFYSVALLATPFLMTVVCGGAPAIRSQLILPLLTGFLAYTVANLLVICRADKQGMCLGGRGTVALFLAISLIGIWNQTSTTMSLYYTAEMCYEQDVYLGRSLITEIDRLQSDEPMQVVIVGTREFHANNACLTGEMIGVSFFSHDADVEPAYYWSTRRVLGFFHILGADYPQVGREQMGEVVQYGNTMPVWPAEGSIQVYNDMIIVKIGETK